MTEEISFSEKDFSEDRCLEANSLERRSFLLPGQDAGDAENILLHGQNGGGYSKVSWDYAPHSDIMKSGMTDDVRNKKRQRRQGG